MPCNRSHWTSRSVWLQETHSSGPGRIIWQHCSWGIYVREPGFPGFPGWWRPKSETAKYGHESRGNQISDSNVNLVMGPRRVPKPETDWKTLVSCKSRAVNRHQSWGTVNEESEGATKWRLHGVTILRMCCSHLWSEWVSEDVVVNVGGSKEYSADTLIKAFLAFDIWSP
jgi:hypothetical protein